MASSSSPSSSYLLLCVSMFLAVSSVGRAWTIDYDFNPYDYLFSPPADPKEKKGCDDVKRYFPACQDYLNGQKDSPSSTCCYNLLILKAVTDEEGPRKICQCIEDLKMSFVESRIKQIYNKCDIHLNFPISEHMDCSSV